MLRNEASDEKPTFVFELSVLVNKFVTILCPCSMQLIATLIHTRQWFRNIRQRKITGYLTWLCSVFFQFSVVRMKAFKTRGSTNINPSEQHRHDTDLMRATELQHSPRERLERRRSMIGLHKVNAYESPSGEIRRAKKG
jgi:hypothetical protein